jgi:MinD-like ATPase involved in chromosome partitioning or flagellar assembly
MYVSTFYSYKGGVGRTMALANVATNLVRQGRRVLLVDFDLEAPGLDTFKQFRPRRPTPGIVEYVSDYLAMHESPDVADYVYEVILPAHTSDPASRNEAERSSPEGSGLGENGTEASGGGGRLWIMPAGRRDASYSSLLQAIDWSALYDQHDGFLMFEDLKEQWKECIGLDYVLIDSRTGHTDVAGICTRQLPNAVFLFFFPNDQNLRGLEGIVKDICQEAQAPRNKNIALHFVMSNVPDLDDEDRILRDRRVEFRNKLQFRKLLVIHHYNSLALLNQSIFCEERPRSRLAQEYRNLGRELIARNPEDREGALLFLRQYVDEGPKSADADETLKQITDKHSEDGDIQTQLAFLRMEDGELDRAKSILEKAIKMSVRSPGTLVRRAQCRRLLLDDPVGATSDALSALKLRAIEEVDAFKAVKILSELKSVDLLRQLVPPSKSRDLSPRVRLIIASELKHSREELPSAVAALKSVIEDPRIDENLHQEARERISLPLIGLGKFNEAMEMICPDPSKVKLLELPPLFNYAMAKWGAVGGPDSALFQRVVSLDSQGTETESPNYAQCLAIAHSALGNLEIANQFADRAEALISNEDSEFSCWRYLEIDSINFRRDLASIRAMIGGSNERPQFLRNESADSTANRSES